MKAISEVVYAERRESREESQRRSTRQDTSTERSRGSPDPQHPRAHLRRQAAIDGVHAATLAAMGGRRGGCARGSYSKARHHKCPTQKPMPIRQKVSIRFVSRLERIATNQELHKTPPSGIQRERQQYKVQSEHVQHHILRVHDKKVWTIWPCCSPPAKWRQAGDISELQRRLDRRYVLDLPEGFQRDLAQSLCDIAALRIRVYHKTQDAHQAEQFFRQVESNAAASRYKTGHLPKWSVH